MFHAKIKALEFETKNVLLGNFSLKLRKMIVISGISIQELQKTVHAKQKNKINFGTKIALFGYFGL